MSSDSPNEHYQEEVGFNEIIDRARLVLKLSINNGGVRNFGSTELEF